MSIEVVTEKIPADKQVAIDVPSSQSRQSRRTRWVLGVLVFLVTAILGSLWWSGLLSSEEEAYLGRWVSIDSWTFSEKEKQISSELFRELELLPGHQVRLKVWEEPIGSLFLFSANGAIYPARQNPPFVISATPHPASLPALTLKTPPKDIATGIWKVVDGQLSIDWDSELSLLDISRETYSKFFSNVQIIHTTPTEANGTLTLNEDDRLTIQWTLKSSKITGYVPPPQVWSRQPKSP